MSIKVLKAGLLSSIQDLGRRGYQKYGIIVNGAMDTYSLRMANILVNNEEDESVLEITLIGPDLQFTRNTLFAITGGDLSPTINGKPVPLWKPVYVSQGSILKFGACKTGCRAYLAVAGGYDIPKVMGSKSTYLRAGIGGYQGRALQSGDVLPLRLDDEWHTEIKSSNIFIAPAWSLGRHHIPNCTNNITVRITPGNQFEQFTSTSKENFLNSSFLITTQSDRMGYRLSGPALSLEKPLEMISEAVSFGTVQVPPDGNPIILLADRQTAGGYPKIAQVAMVDLPIVAQARPGSKLRFQQITLTEAEKLFVEQEHAIKILKTAIYLKLA